jgi:hypothetical protein
MEADLTECEKVFVATGVRAGKRDIRFCRRIGEKGKSKGKRPILVGMKSELVKAELLDAAKELQNTRYKHVSIGPDQTRKQKQAETALNEEVNRKNREEFSEEDRSKNLRWMVVGRKGEKRIVKKLLSERTGKGQQQAATGSRGPRGGTSRERGDERKGEREASRWKRP